MKPLSTLLCFSCDVFSPEGVSSAGETLLSSSIPYYSQNNNPTYYSQHNNPTYYSTFHCTNLTQHTRKYHDITAQYNTVPAQHITAVQVVFNPFSQFISQVELYSRLQLSLQSDPIALGVPIFIYFMTESTISNHWGVGAP